MSDAGRTLPPGASLEQQKKQARELIRAVRAGDAAALSRVRTHLPDKTRLTLADAQFVLAREYGFRSWAELKRHIEGAAKTEVVAEDQDALIDEFRRACSQRDAKALRQLFERSAAARALVNAPLFPFDSPALVHLAGSADTDVIDVLLELGADPDRRSGWWAGGFHPLYFATPRVAERLIRAGATIDTCAAAHLDRVDLLRELLEAEPARVHERGGDGQTPLHFARSIAAADLLLERGADINARDVDHRSTPAEWMLDRHRGAGRYELARHLVRRGANADIFLAAALGLTDRLAELIEADPTLFDCRIGQGEYGEKPPASYPIIFWTIGQNLSPLQVAAQFEQHEAVELLYDRLRRFARPAQLFLQACATANADEAHRLLREHPRLVEELAPADHRAITDAASAGHAAAVRLMMDLGFNPGAPGRDGGTALHCAAGEGAVECVIAILEHDRGRRLLNERDPAYGGTPLGWCAHGAVYCGNPHADHVTVAQLLLRAGAQPLPDLEHVPDALREVIEPFLRRDEGAG